MVFLIGYSWVLFLYVSVVVVFTGKASSVVTDVEGEYCVVAIACGAKEDARSRSATSLAGSPKTQHNPSNSQLLIAIRRSITPSAPRGCLRALPTTLMGTLRTVPPIASMQFSSLWTVHTL